MKVFFLFFLMIASCTAFANCSSGTSSYSSNIADLNISIPQNAPMGPIGNVISFPSGPSVSVTCSGSGANYAMLKYGTSMIESSTAGVYKTNVPGIGFKIWDDFSGSTITQNSPVSNDLKQWYKVSVSAWNGTAWLTNVKLQFYITGPVATGKDTFSGVSVESWLGPSTSTSQSAHYQTLNISGSINVTAGTCDTSSFSVDMGTHKSSEFENVGSQSTPTSFSIALRNCASAVKSIYYMLTPPPGVQIQGSGANENLSLTSSSTADGVGVQVLDDKGSLIPLNTEIKFSGYNLSANDDIPLQVQYIRTGVVKPGTANSAVEFTMFYK